MDQDEGVDHLTACFCHVEGLLFSWQSLLESELLLNKRKNKNKKNLECLV